MRIRLLGVPTLENDGESIRLEGRKTWALLAYLLLESRPPTRRELVDRLWSDADDPLGAARWALSQVRKALAPSATVVDREGRLVFEATAPVAVDARELLAGSWDPGDVDDLVRGELLESWDFEENPEFARWLGIQRARLASAALDALRSGASLLARSEPVRALALAERALLDAPFDDALHALIVEIHTMSGDTARATAYADRLAARYREELGAALPAVVARALDLKPAPTTTVPSDALALAESLLGTALARHRGGDFLGAYELARRAADVAAAAGDAGLEARALAAATNDLTHAMNGVPQECVWMLQRAARLATEAGDRTALCDVERERGRIAAILGHLGAAEAAFQRAVAIAIELGDRRREAIARLFMGIDRTDSCDYALAEADLLAALDRHPRPALVLAWLARLLVKMTRYDEAEATATRAIALMDESADLLQLPLALAQAGEVRFVRGDHRGATERFARAYAVAQTTNDATGIALALRGLALLDHREGRPERARQTMREALSQAAMTQRWVEAAIIADLVEMESGADRALVERGLRIARAAPMPDLAERLARFSRSHTPAHTVAP